MAATISTATPGTALFGSASPTLTLLSSSSASPTPSESPGAGNASPQSQSDRGDTAPGSLYLFTFLTTLLLLLTVSFGIVLRSFVLRRRFRRRVEAAIAAGVLLPGALGPGGGSGGRRAQEKPKLWEVWMDEEKGAEGGAEDWGDIMPISAQFVNPPTTPPPLPPALPRRTPARVLASLFPPNSNRPLPLFLNRLPPTSPPLSPPPTTTTAGNNNPLSPTFTEPTGPEQVQVTVLIAMPSQATHASGEEESSLNLKGKAKASGGEDEDDIELPEVCFGTTEVEWRGGVVPGRVKGEDEQA